MHWCIIPTTWWRSVTLRCAAGIHVSNVTYHAYHLHLPHAKHTNSSCQLHQRMKSGAESLMEIKRGRKWREGEKKDKEREHSLSSAEESDEDRRFIDIPSRPVLACLDSTTFHRSQITQKHGKKKIRKIKSTELHKMFCYVFGVMHVCWCSRAVPWVVFFSFRSLVWLLGRILISGGSGLWATRDAITALRYCRRVTCGTRAHFNSRKHKRHLFWRSHKCIIHISKKSSISSKLKMHHNITNFELMQKKLEKRQTKMQYCAL